MRDDGGLLLHSCCGPCTLYPLEELRGEGFRLSGFFYNPNIHPYRELASRLASYQRIAEEEGLETVIEGGYGLAPFLTAINDFGESAYQPKSEERCGVCYRLRLEKTALACREAGIKIFTTTLLVSPYQNHELIKAMGERVAAEYGLTFLYRDFRPGFRHGMAKAKERGLYRQGYCGCIFSEYERYGGER